MFIELLTSIDSFLAWVLWMADNHVGSVSLLVGLFIFVVYLSQKKDQKSNAARLVLQEIRYAEAKVRNYKNHRSYTFAEKILPTNSWNKNISFFVKDLNEQELDLISKFYSNATYLDDVIKAVSDQHNKEAINPLPDQPQEAAQSIDTSSLPPQGKELISQISSIIEGVYNTPAANKLSKIAEKKWYHIL